MKKRDVFLLIGFLVLLILAVAIGYMSGYMSDQVNGTVSETAETAEGAGEEPRIRLEMGGSEEETGESAAETEEETAEETEEAGEITEETEEETAEETEEETKEETAEETEEETVGPETGSVRYEETDRTSDEAAVRALFAAGERVSDEELNAYGVSAFFSQTVIDDDMFSRIYGKSFGYDCTTPRESLRYLRVLYYDFGGERRVGELICNRAISDDLLEIFTELYYNRYPICQMRLVDDFDADDEWSASEDNTSCFNYRNVAGTNTLSNHATGMAIDINPLENPYVKFDGAGNVTYCSPANGIGYVDRSASFSHKIDSSDLCTRLFLEHGFTWGGTWNSPDYMHFEKR